MKLDRRCRLLSVLACASIAAGCGMSKQAQLEAVAKDWCMTIRASQVIPVYPLTADMQPGDIFLVQTTIDRQQEIYKKRGFLPLDNHLARLHPTGYPAFYDHSFMLPDAATGTVLPGQWIRPTEGSRAWAAAPSAAFPSYSFTVDQGAGFNLAVPVKGIPVGLALLGARSAEGSVSIQRASVMGIDIVSLYRDLDLWAQANSGFLRAFAPSQGRRNYLRIVTRVYATGQVAISLSDSRSVSGGADVGQPRPVDLVMPKRPESLEDTGETSLENYRRSIQALNEMLAETNRQIRADAAAAAAAPGTPADPADAPDPPLSEEDAAALAEGAPSPASPPGAFPGASNMIPGGSLRVAAASSRFITLEQEFDPPLVIGYLGFDCEIRENGLLGPPIPTHAVVDPGSQGDPFRSEELVRSLYGDFLPRDAYEQLQAAAPSSPGARAAVERLDALASFVPDTLRSYQTGADGALEIVEEESTGRNYLQFQSWIGATKQNALELDRRLTEDSLTVRRIGANETTTETIRPGTPQWAALEADRDAARAALANPNLDAQRRNAYVFAGFEYLRLMGGPAPTH